MSLLQWLSLASVCLAGAASPGPSLAVVLKANLTGGRLALTYSGSGMSEFHMSRWAYHLPSIFLAA